AIITLGAIEPDSGKVTAAVARFLRDPDMTTRLAALEVTVDRNNNDDAIIENLIEIVPSKWPGESLKAVTVLSRCDVRNPRVREILLQLLNGKWSNDTRVLQAHTIEEIGKVRAVDAPDIVQTVRSLMQHDHPYVRIHAACS